MYALIDIDDTIADLITVWLRRYNRKYKDNLKKESLTDWNLALFTKPECGNRIFEFIESPNLYNYIKPMPLALDGISALRNLGFEIVYNTYSTNGAAGSKFRWLQKHGFWKKEDHYIETKSKFLIKGDLMIDDGWHNIEKFAGFSLLIDQPWNRKFNHPNRMYDWKDIIENINKYRENK